MAELHETRIGQRLLDGHIPAAVKALEEIARCLVAIQVDMHHIAKAVILLTLPEDENNEDEG